MTTETGPVSPDTSATRQRTLRPIGAFDLGQTLDFGFGQREAQSGEQVMRLGFVTDDLQHQVGVAVHPQPDGTLRLEISGSPGADPDQVATQVARVLSVDVDATGWDELGRREPLIGRLQAARPGLRPPLFHSAYEAAAWAVLSARRPHAQMVEVRRRLSEAHGAIVQVAGADVAVMPTPQQLLEVAEFATLPEVKLRRLHGVAAAALDGRLDTVALKALPVDEAEARLRELDGIGPFYAQLVTVRALGHTDAVPLTEPILLAEAGRLFGHDGPFTAAEYADAVAPLTPWRTWASVAIRAAGPRLA